LVSGPLMISDHRPGAPWSLRFVRDQSPRSRSTATARPSAKRGLLNGVNSLPTATDCGKSFGITADFWRFFGYIFHDLCSKPVRWTIRIASRMPSFTGEPDFQQRLAPDGVALRIDSD